MARPRFALGGVYSMTDYMNRALHAVNGLTMWEWFAVLLVVVAIGFVCMKGFGSRNQY